jgi:hypothetical protein
MLGLLAVAWGVIQSAFLALEIGFWKRKNAEDPIANHLDRGFMKTGVIFSFFESFVITAVLSCVVRLGIGFMR